MALSLSILIEGDAKQFVEVIDQIKKESQDLDDALSGIGTKASVAFAAFSAAIVGSLVAFRESEKVMAQLDATLLSTGRSSQISSASIAAYANELQKSTIYGDEAIITAQTMLLKFQSLDKDGIKKATASAADLATVMGGDLPSAAQFLGKALENPQQGITLLTKQGVNFTDEQKKMIKTFDETGQAAKAQAIIFGQVEAAFGGSAKAATNGLGVYIQLKEVLGDIIEGIGKQFAPSFSEAGKVLLKFATYVKDNEVLLSTIARLLAAGAGMAGFIAAVTLGTLAISKIVVAFQILQVSLFASRVAMIAFMGAATLGIGVILAFLPEIIAFAKDMVTAFVAAKDALIKLFTDLFVNIGNIIMKYIQLYAAFFDWKKILTGDLSGIKAAGKALSEAVTKTIDDAFGGVKDVKQAVSVKFESDAKGAADAAKKEADAKALAEKNAEDARKKQEEDEKASKARMLAETQRNAALDLQIAKAKREQLAAERRGESDDVIKIKEQEVTLLKNLKDAEGSEDRAIAQRRLEVFRQGEDEKIQLAQEKDGVRRELAAASAQGQIAEVIKFKEQEIGLIKALEDAKSADERELAAMRLAEFRASEDEKIAAIIEKADEERLQKQVKALQEREERLAIEAEYAALDEESRLLAQEQDLAKLNEQELIKKDALRRYAEDEAKAKQAQRDQQLKDQIKYGEAYATINAAMNSNEMKGVQTATGQLAQLTQSKNSTLKGIGKAAALTQLGIDTAKSAMSIYAGFATIPIVGPALGVAGAAAAIAFGAEKMNQVRSAQAGGVVPGVGSGDIQPMMTEPGEIIVPKALSPTFEQRFGNLSADEGSPATRREYHIGTIIGTEEFVKGSLIPAIRDATQLDNANLGVG